jgi:urea transport system ATP-binding protein
MRKLTVLIVEQYLEFVLSLSDYIYVMEKGAIALEGQTSLLERSELQRIMTD